jgi:transposase-like protein
MLNCPRCHSKRIHRSRRKGIFERKVLAMMSVRPYRCDLCDHRFFRRALTALRGALRTAGTH